MGSRLEQATALSRGALRAAVLLLACVACAAHAGSQPRSLYGSMRIHSGTESDFAGVTCHDGLEANDRDEKRDVAAELRRRLAANTPPLEPCKAGAPRKLLVSYQAGRGVCIDCGSTGEGWSGFAFVTVNDSAGNEIARAEWTGGGGADGIQLVRRFADDLIALVRKK